MKAVLTIAGSDPSGGAGIQKDLATFNAIGVHGLSAITALTIQSAQEVKAVEPVNADTVKAQALAACEGQELGAIKTGMLAKAEIVAAVLEIKELYPDVPLIVDPVLISTSGKRLLDEDAMAALQTLCSKASLVTPNIPEAEALTGVSFDPDSGVEKLGEAMLDMGCKAALIKGGHNPQGDVLTDWLITKSGLEQWSHERLPGNFRGTGCMYASAIAAYLAKGDALETAIGRAHGYLVENLIQGIRKERL